MLMQRSPRLAYAANHLPNDALSPCARPPAQPRPSWRFHTKDGAGWHRARDLIVPAEIDLIFLPPSSPELQPAEHRWALVDEPIANRCFPDLAALETVLTTRCQTLRQDRVTIQAHPQVHWWPDDLLDTITVSLIRPEPGTAPGSGHSASRTCGRLEMGMQFRLRGRDAGEWLEQHFSLEVSEEAHDDGMIEAVFPARHRRDRRARFARCRGASIVGAFIHSYDSDDRCAICVSLRAMLMWVLRRARR
ncbi:MAG: hypothetical protein QM753_07445 [Thermomicrobiales bacterium]